MLNSAAPLFAFLNANCALAPQGAFDPSPNPAQTLCAAPTHYTEGL